MRKLYLKQIFTILIITTTTSLSLSAQQSKVALISVFIDKNLTGDLNDEVLKNMSSNDYFKFDSISKNFKNRFFSQYAKNLPLDFLAEDSVIKNPEYKALGLGEMNDNNSQRYATPKGYVYINSRWPYKDKTSINNAFKLLPSDVDFVMIAYVNFDLIESFKVGMVSFSKMRAYVNFKIMDRTGKQVASIKEYGKSHDSTVGLVYSGVTFSDVKKLRPLCYQALNKLYLDLEKDLPKDTKKIKRKIKKWKKKQKR